MHFENFISLRGFQIPNMKRGLKKRNHFFSRQLHSVSLYYIQVDGCNEEAFMIFDDVPENDICFTHTWNTPSRREQLFGTCNVLGREVGTLLLSDIRWTVENAHTSEDCSSDEVIYLRETLEQGHAYSIANMKVSIMLYNKCIF